MITAAIRTVFLGMVSREVSVFSRIPFRGLLWLGAPCYVAGRSLPSITATQEVGALSAGTLCPLMMLAKLPGGVAVCG